MRQLVYNAIQTPDGTILTSHYHHHFVEYVDKNGQYYAVDGGRDYTRTLFDIPDYKDLCLYEDDSFEKIRKVFCRGGRGIDGMLPLTWTPICKMSDEWLQASIDYNNKRFGGNSIDNQMYNAELIYRELEKLK